MTLPSTKLDHHQCQLWDLLKGNTRDLRVIPVDRRAVVQIHAEMMRDEVRILSSAPLPVTRLTNRR